jgi:uncharacterized protein (TIGR02271 family)
MTLPSFRTTEGVVVSSQAAVKPGRLLAPIAGNPIRYVPGWQSAGDTKPREGISLRGSTSIAELRKEDVPQLRNIPVFAADGEQIGHVGDVYYDETSEQITCVGVPGDTLGFKNVMVPVSGAQLTNEGLQLPYRKDQLRDFGDADGELDADRWEQERGYYGGGASRGTIEDADASLTRSEEELHVGTERAQSGQVRLRKYVETEPVEAQVELQRETVDVERRPVDREVSGADFEEKEVEVSLHEERPVVEKQAVAKEEVSLSKNVETERQTVRDDVRKERIEVEEDR